MLNIPKRNVVFFGVLGALLFLMYIVMVYAPNHARLRLQSMLHDAGFDRAYVRDISLSPTGILAKGITLDAYGLDGVEEIRARINWPSFLLTGALKQVEIKKLSASLSSESLTLATQKLVENLLNLPRYKIDITEATIDMATDFGNIRLMLDAHINREKNDKARDVRARLHGAQYQLGFDSTWEGKVTENGAMDLSGNIAQGRMDMGPVRISRFNGWAALTLSKGAYAIQSQLEAGSANLDHIPLEKISLVTDHKPGQASVILRAGVSGAPQTSLGADYAQQNDTKTFSTSFKGNDLGALLKRVREDSKKMDDIPDTLLKIKSFDLAATYQPDRGFAGGPLPFTLTLAGDGSSANGNILIYPENYDIRGSIEMDDALARAIGTYFNIPKDNIKGRFVRLDGNIAKSLNVKQSVTKTPVP